MQGLLESRSVGDEITICIHCANGDNFEQSLPIDFADDVQDFINWYRNPKRDKVYTFYSAIDHRSHLIQYNQITAVVIDGYIEPEGRQSRWYERIIDRIRLRWL